MLDELNADRVLAARPSDSNASHLGTGQDRTGQDSAGQSRAKQGNWQGQVWNLLVLELASPCRLQIADRWLMDRLHMSWAMS